MAFLTILVNLIVALTLLNVWLIRFNKKTKFRGGDSNLSERRIQCIWSSIMVHVFCWYV